MAPAKPLMCVRIDPVLKRELERAARADERSLSSLVGKVLRD
jgi:predicted HicB family RNase H-like nuclease